MISDSLTVNMEIERVDQVNLHPSEYYSYDSYRNGYYGYIDTDNFSKSYDITNSNYFKIQQDRYIIDEDYQKLKFKYIPGFSVS